MERGAAAQQHWLLRRGSNDPRRLEVPEAQVDRGPLVSEDGGWVAWVTRSPGRAASITSAAMDARGRYVAASTTTSLSIGSIRDTIVALRTRDGGEVFRRALPTYARSQVAFLGDGYFAYSDVEGTHSRTRVLRITD
jgi:hypothetical protein